ncbi:hypothetical protein CWI75_12125 [Kineobactrum sediminis]|uniref:DUF4397 domain-containing protein n=1 Tax=Kineobactrum sediminis TaxID=1905677 RepID=A0A2N5Y272_9GAMM|nr:DUF4397 domain-containing protein [Kineobactrum sediminis]PLW82491.1 hypothetical protein CWI75_12125 [Kineobactrum sediminis]
MKMRNFLAASAAVLVLSACSDSDDNFDVPDVIPPPPVIEPAELRITHAAPDAPNVNVYVDGELALDDVAFRQSSGLIVFDEPGSFEIEVRGLLPDGSEVSVIGPVDLDLEEGIRTDVVAYDTLFDANGDLNIKAKILEPVAIESDITDVRLSVMHAAPAAAEVDIYVTAPEDALSSVDPLDAAFGDALGPLALEPDTDYRVRITGDGSDAVVYDSGTLSFTAGTELLVLAVNNTYKVGTNPVNLLAVDAEGATEVVDPTMGVEVRVVHNSADTPAVDVLVDDTAVLETVPFPVASNYDDIQVQEGTYNVVVAASADNSIAPIDTDLTLVETQSYTVLAIGSFAENSVQALVTVDDRRSVASEAKVEVIHGSSIVAGEIPVDVYLTADGVIADAEPAIENLAYADTTGQLPVTPGEYWVTVTATGDKSVVAFDSNGPIALGGGVNYTVIARDPSSAEVSGSPLIRLTILTD